MHKLYIITNQINKKVYVGITKLSLDQRWKQHIFSSKTPKYPIQYAIKKYGSDNFVITLLKEDIDRKIISEQEEPTILKFNSRTAGYNVAKGGYGGDLGPEANARRIDTMLNRSDDEKHKRSLAQSARQTGRTKANDLGRLAQSEKMLGNTYAIGYNHTEITKQLISEANAKPKSKETKLKMSKSAILNCNIERISKRLTSCICCQRQWDIGNYTKHIMRNIK